MEFYIGGFTRDISIAHSVARALDRNPTGFYGSRSYVLLAEVLQTMGIDVKDFARVQVDVTDIMKQLGWLPKRIRIFGKITRVWMAPSNHSPSLVSHGNLVTGTDLPESQAGQGSSGGRSVPVSSRPGWD